MSESLVSSIQQLILLGKGDRGRLEYLLEMISKNRALTLSDQRYLEGIIPLYLGPQDPESLKRSADNAINQLYGEVRNLDERLQKLERRGFKRYFGRKTALFFVTLFLGWNVFQDPITSAIGPYLRGGFAVYLFPLNSLATDLGREDLVWLAFVAVLLVWPFIGAAHLSRFIKSRKIREMDAGSSKV